MIPQFAALSTEESQLMYDAIPMITVLIAGADGQIDQDETDWGKKIAKIRSYDAHESLQDFYKKVGETYSDKLSGLINTLPSDTAARTSAISDQLGKLNGVLTSLEPEFAKRYYDGLVTFAEHVAKSSGGFLGFGSISKAEKDLMGLPMITPIVIEEES